MDDRAPYLALGAVKNVSLNISISNLGDDAYDTNVSFNFSRELFFIKMWQKVSLRIVKGIFISLRSFGETFSILLFSKDANLYLLFINLNKKLPYISGSTMYFSFFALAFMVLGFFLQKSIAPVLIVLLFILKMLMPTSVVELKIGII